MPLHTPTAPRRAGLARAAIIVAAAGIITGGATIAIDGSTAAEANQPAVSRYHDIEANKAIAIAALGLRASEQATRPSGYHDLEENKARIAQAR